mmetsp:Transcript_131900/g.367718  ORF Transcript_131900/g.367718 Transcript_131900/m.367718 type:complete len:222 (+) Transcript_131900:375-1040(+)
MVPARLDRKPALVLRVGIGQAEVRVEHHLQRWPLVDPTGPALVPLVLPPVAADGPHRPPALPHQGNEVVVVELVAVQWIAPPPIVAGVLWPGTPQSVYPHQRCCPSRSQSHVLDEGLRHGSAAVLRIREAVGCSDARLCRPAPETELALEVERWRVGVILAQHMRSRHHHDGLCRYDKEVGKRHCGAEFLVDFLERHAVLAIHQASLESSVVRVGHVCASV